MEKVKGNTWATCAELFVNEPLHAISAVRQLIDAIARLHAWDFIHGDLHEWNILYAQDSSHVTLLDFGYSSLGERGYDDASSLRRLKVEYSFARLRTEFTKHCSYSKVHDWYSVILLLLDVLSASYKSFFAARDPRDRYAADVLFINEIRILLENNILSSKKNSRKRLDSDFCLSTLKNHMWFDSSWKAPVLMYWRNKVRFHYNKSRSAKLDKMIESIAKIERKYYDGKLLVSEEILDHDSEFGQLVKVFCE